VSGEHSGKSSGEYDELKKNPPGFVPYEKYEW